LESSSALTTTFPELHLGRQLKNIANAINAREGL
jgi:hypothetical protein